MIPPAGGYGDPVLRLVHFDFVTTLGGAQQSMAYLARRLAERHEVYVVDAYGKCEPYRRAIAAAHLPYEVVMPDARHIYIGHRGVKRLKSALVQIPELGRLRARLAATISRINPDAIWVMNAKSLTFVAACSPSKRIPIAYAARGWATPDRVGPWFRFLLKHRVAAVMAVSTATAGQLRQAGVPADRLHVTSSAIDLEVVTREAQRPLHRPLPGMDRAPRLLMMAARPEKAKGHAAAVRTVARLVRAGRSPVLWIPGRPPVGGDDRYVKALQRQCRDLNIENNVYFLGWRDDMPQLIEASDICLLPSHTEGLPRSVLEAMLLRRPVIATPVGGIPDAIVDGVTGHLAPIDDDAAMADHVERLITDSKHRSDVVGAAYDHLRRAFDPEQNTRKVERVFRLIASPAA